MIFPLEDLCQVTDNFSKEKLIGKGGFGHVYRAKLRHSDVAIKVLNTVCGTEYKNIYTTLTYSVGCNQ